MGKIDEAELNKLRDQVKHEVQRWKLEGEDTWLKELIGEEGMKTMVDSEWDEFVADMILIGKGIITCG